MSDKIKDEEIRIDGYTVQRLDQQGGGWLIYYRDDLDVIPKPKLEVKSVESIWIVGCVADETKPGFSFVCNAGYLD